MEITADSKTDGFRFALGAFDLDGTVLRRDLTITEATLRSLGRLRGLGVRLVVATGRRYEAAREHARRLGFGEEDPVICYGGSVVRRINGETLLHRTLPVQASLEVLRWAAERGLHARLFLDGRIVSSPNTSAVVRHMRYLEEPGLSVVDSPALWLERSGEPPIKIVVVDHPEEIEGWLREAREAFRGRLFVTRSLPHYVEIGNPAGTKSKALAFLCERWGIGREGVLAFGDAENDIDMLRFAGHGVAVGGMNAAVREAADAVAAPIEEDGVARYIERLLGEA